MRSFCCFCSSKFNQMAALGDITRSCLRRIHSFTSIHLNPFNTHFHPTHMITYVPMKPLVIKAKARKPANTRTESDKILNRRMRKKFNGTPKKPRLSVFCSDKQLYAMLVDDENKKCLFYASTIQKAIRSNPDITTEEAARVVGEELVKAASDLKIHEISSYDLNGSAVRGLRGQRIRAFESVISSYGFLP